ncbi:MAG: hypothetical protein ACFFD7_15450 [Candidatus Thorarchaeota archaeon]
MSLTKTQIRNRVIFVGDRIAFGVLISCGILILLFAIFTVLEKAMVMVVNPWFLLILGIDVIVFFMMYVITNEEFYYVERIFMNSNFMFVELVWLNLTLLISLSLSLIYGWHHILEITIIYLIIYLTGYFLARFIWKGWKRLQKSWKTIIILSLIFIPLTFSGIISILYFQSGNIRYGVISLIYGLGILGSTGLNALMLQLFLDKSGNDVLEDPPSKLVIIGIINTLIVSFFVWFLMIIFVPIPPVSKRGKSVKFSYPKKGSISRGRVIFGGYRRRRYIFFGPVVDDYDRYSADHYWNLAMTKKELRDPISQSRVKEAKKRIIEVLIEEEIVPTSKDLQSFVNCPHLIFDAALDELKDEGKIRFHLFPESNWWSKGYSITGQYYLKLEKKGKLKAVDLDEEAVSTFLEKMRKKGTVRSKYQVWEIANDAGIRPRWKITPTINELKKTGVIKYSRKKPIGWSVLFTISP